VLGKKIEGQSKEKNIRAYHLNNKSLLVSPFRTLAVGRGEEEYRTRQSKGVGKGSHGPPPVM